MIQSESLVDMSHDEDLLTEHAEVISLRRKDISEEEDDDDDDDEDTEDHDVGQYGGDDDENSEIDDVFRDRRGYRAWFHSRPCAVCVYLCLALMLLASIVSLIVVGVLIGLPYHRVSHFLPAQCTLKEVQMDDEHRRCSCGKGCNSLYPCITIKVQFIDTHDNVHTTVMYENESTLNRKCSYYPVCKSSHLSNQESVQRYIEAYGVLETTTTCYYNPANARETIRTKRFHKSHLIHAMLWPCVILTVAFIILSITVKKRGCDFL